MWLLNVQPPQFTIELLKIKALNLKKLHFRIYYQTELIHVKAPVILDFLSLYTSE